MFANSESMIYSDQDISALSSDLDTMDVLLPGLLGPDNSGSYVSVYLSLHVDTFPNNRIPLLYQSKL